MQELRADFKRGNQWDIEKRTASGPARPALVVNDGSRNDRTKQPFTASATPCAVYKTDAWQTNPLGD
ncbi:uncharacterized protein TrAFT101_005419 [Trichoderma asperellum]|uniref:uncharacterized protein n=1 Tax=Trichoderma asperellum TaxID=101201 RepID=UPI0033202ED1|nr:hypothetical protein TrAFT101_005419 [Trichoderma asperellum]